MANQGGSHQQHVKAGEQSHKKMDQKSTSGSRNDDRQSSATRGDSNQQHAKPGQQSHKKS